MIIIYIVCRCVTVNQFRRFVKETKYATEAEAFGWSFVFEPLASNETIKRVDGEEGYGRVKESPHWMAVQGLFFFICHFFDGSLNTLFY